MQKQILKTFFLLALFLAVPRFVLATGTYLDFHDFPATSSALYPAAGSVPGDSLLWQYRSGVTNNLPSVGETWGASWMSKTIQSDGYHVFWIDDYDAQYQCSSHGSVSTFNYLDISPSGRNGNALRQVITGGYNADPVCAAFPNGGASDGEGPTGGPPCGCPPNGTQLFNKESYTGSSQIYTGGPVGNSYINFHRINDIGTSPQRVTTPYNAVAGANRMYVYVYQPSCQVNGSSNGPADYTKYLQQTYQMGLFLDGNSTGAHQYYNFYTQGGGWAKMQIEETTNGDNNGDQVTRCIPDMLQGNSVLAPQSNPNNVSTGLWQWYMTTLPYNGQCTPPWQILVDNIAFDNDTYTPQNQTTISNISVMYNDSSKTWEISFNDEYKNLSPSQADATYQVKYSTTGPITNENWNSATPVNILPSSTFGIDARSDGIFAKWNTYTQGVWAPFNLSSTDANNLTPGQTIYFAVLDISQQGCPLNPSGVTGVTTGSACTQTPNDTIHPSSIGYPYSSTPGNGEGGRTYATNPTYFDWADDQNNLPYIKRISYTLAGTTSSDTTPPAAPSGFSVI